MTAQQRVCQQRSTKQKGEKKTIESNIVQAISVRKEVTLSEIRSVAWNQRRTQERWALEEPHPLAETHFQKFARSRPRRSMSEETAPRPGLWSPSVMCASHFVMEPSSRGPPWEKKATLKPPANRTDSRRSGQQSENAWAARQIRADMTKISKRHHNLATITGPCSNGASLRLLTR